MTKRNLHTENIEKILEKQHDFIAEQKTLDVEFRKEALIILKKTIKKYESDILSALEKDLHKGGFEAFSTEIGYVYSSISNTLKNIKKWVKPKKVKTPVYLLPAKEYIVSEPYGSVLVIGPYNYPFQLVIEPLVGAISGGNCAVVKPSELTPNTSSVISKIIGEAFEDRYVACIEGGVETNIALTESNFDYIFFTGSPEVGKLVMKAAAENLVPVTLELGGKSPVIIDETANVKAAAKRIIWGKTVNAGQTCIAPDYLIVHENVKEKLVNEMKNAIEDFYGDDPEQSNDFGRIVNLRHFDRIKALLDKDKDLIVHGGKTNRDSLYIEPTLLVSSSRDIATMSEEIFGPVLPMLTYMNINKVITDINSNPKPLALYVFSEDKAVQSKMINSIPSGGACVNDIFMHIVNPLLPFGGVGNSGMGSYHGKHSFDTFTHKKSVSIRGTKINMTMLFPPYSNKKLSMVKKFFK